MNLIEHYIDLHNYIHDNIYMLDNNYNQMFEATILMEAYQTNYRRELAATLNFNNIQVGSDPNKMTLKLILPSNEKINEKYNTNIQKDIINLFISMANSKIGEVRDGMENSLSWKSDVNNNEFHFYIYNKFDDSHVKKILSDIPKNYQELQNNRFTKFNYKSSAKYKDDETLNKEVNELKQKFNSLSKPASETIIIDLSNPKYIYLNNMNKFDDIETYWNYIFNVFVCFVGYVRGQWIYKYIENNLNEVNSIEALLELNKIEFNNDLTEIGDRGRYFHLNNDNYDKDIFKNIYHIQNTYNIKLDIHGKNPNPEYKYIPPSNKYDDYHKKFYDKIDTSFEYPNNEDNNENDEYLNHDEYYNSKHKSDDKDKPGLKKFKDKYSESVFDESI